MIKRLDKMKMLAVTGKGGVGKSVVTATLGRLMAARGRRVLICSTLGERVGCSVPSGEPNGPGMPPGRKIIGSASCVAPARRS